MEFGKNRMENNEKIPVRITPTGIPYPFTYDVMHQQRLFRFYLPLTPTAIHCAFGAAVYSRSLAASVSFSSAFFSIRLT